MIYADYNGSAPLCSNVKEYLLERLNELENFANPNASHKIGNRLARRIEKARKACAKALGCETNQIIFNSGSSEGISHIFHSILDHKKKRGIIITSAIEHLAVIKAAQYWEDKGHNLKFVNTLSNGEIDIKHLEVLLSENQGEVDMVSIMSANNETGVIQPFIEIGKLCEKHKTPFLCDTTQYIGKIEFDFKSSHIDYAVSSSHKVGSLIGVGFIIAREPNSLKSFIHGGGQENGLRAGTQNYIGVECLGVALENFKENSCHLATLKEARESFENKLLKKFPNCFIIGSDAPRLAGTTLVSFSGRSSRDIQMKLEESGIFVTTSSACSDSKDKISHVLESMGVDPERGTSVVRISLCTKNPKESYDEIFEVLSQIS